MSLLFYAVLLPAVPVYKMSRSLVYITDIWRVYKVGLGENPSIENLESNFKMIREGLTLRESLTLIDFCSTSKLTLRLKS